MQFTGPTYSLIVLALASFFAGAMNSMAGGGSFITLPALIFTGIDARAANITATMSLFPGQFAASVSGRKLVQGVGGMSFRTLVIVSTVGGVGGALLLLATPPHSFDVLVPWLILFATIVFTWGSFFRKPGPVAESERLPAWVAVVIQFFISVYGGYFGGGIGFLMLATLTLAGVAIRNAGATKNALAGLLNAAAAIVFLFSSDVAWLQAAIIAVCAIGGGLSGVWLLKRIPEKVLRAFVVLVGVLLTIGMFLRA